MKKSLNVIIIALFALVMGCEQEEDLSPKFSDVSWFTGQENQTTFNLEVGDYLTFIDLSQNPVSHKWKISEGGFFLEPDFTERDSVYDSFIIPNGGLETSASNIHVLFTEPGLQSVHLFNTFKDSVAWFGMDSDTLYSVKEGDLWVIDTTFVVDVFAKLSPSFEVYQGTEKILTLAAGDIPSINDKSTWPTVEVEVGGTLRFIDVTAIGRPTASKWELNVGEDSEILNGTEVEFLYTKLGEYTAGSMTSSRNGESMPNASVSRLIPLIVKGVPSSQPFVATQIAENESEVISVSLSGEVFEPSAKGKQANFTVHVANGNFNRNIVVQSTSANSNDLTKIDLTMAEPIYNTDTITISYDGAGGIKSVDTRSLEAFSDLSVAMYIPADSNPIDTDWAGIEYPFLDGNQNRKANTEGYWVGKDNDVIQYFWRVEDFVFDGTGSMKFETDATGLPKTLILQGVGWGNGGMPAGDYLISYKIYIEPGTTLTTLSCTQNKYDGAPVDFDIDISNTPRGEWVTVSDNIIHNFDADAASGNQWRLVIDATKNPADAIVQKFWFDDLTFLALEVRP